MEERSVRFVARLRQSKAGCRSAFRRDDGRVIWDDRSVGIAARHHRSVFDSGRRDRCGRVSIVAGNLALALPFDPGSESRSSFGNVIIGGVVSSLILTLALIPNMYVWLAPSDEAFSRNGRSRRIPVEQERLLLEPVT